MLLKTVFKLFQHQALPPTHATFFVSMSFDLSDTWT